jgi:MFS transporter, YNFM family, putative membrane transport protein
VGRRAATAKAHASGLYLFAYYLGSSVGGSAGGLAYEHGRWAATVGYGVALLAVAFAAALGVRVCAGEGRTRPVERTGGAPSADVTSVTPQRQ